MSGFYAHPRRLLAEAHLAVREAEASLAAAQSARFAAIADCGHHPQSGPYTVIVGEQAVTVTPDGRRNADFRVTRVVV